VLKSIRRRSKAGLCVAENSVTAPAQVAESDIPFGVAVDAAGNIYVADADNNVVKKISADGTSIAVIGSGFNSPTGVAVDAAGNVYVADVGNFAVKKIAPDSVTVTTLGNGFAFGEPEGHTLQQYTLPGYPNVYVLSNRIVEGRAIGAHNDGIGWHTDYSYKEKPVMCTMLYAVEVPPEGSDTLLADLCAAYDALPEGRKRELDGLVLHHSYQYFMETREYGRMTLSPELRAANPDVFHPLVRTHPADGRKALWVSTGTVKDIVGMPHDRAMGLIEELVVSQGEKVVVWSFFTKSLDAIYGRFAHLGAVRL